MATKKQNFKTMDEAELTKILRDTESELRAHRFAAAGSRPKDTNSLKKARKVIARVMTEQNARKRASVAK